MDQTSPTDTIPAPAMPLALERYWANKPDDQIGDELTSRWKDFQRNMLVNPLVTASKRTYRYYYGLSERGRHASELGSSGEQDELSVLLVNHTRSLIDGKVSVVTKERPALVPMAINGDFKSRAQTILASSVMDFYVRRDLEAAWKKMCEQAFIWSVTYLKAGWDPTQGTEVQPTPENPRPPAWAKTGDIRFSVLTPHDVAFDVRNKTRDHRWMITREFVNRYDLAAQYQPWEEEILALSKEDALEQLQHPSLGLMGGLAAASNDDDLVPVYEFFHKRTPALPRGKHVIFLGTGDVLYSGELPTKNIPVIALSAGDIHGTCWSYSPFWDLGGLQQAANIITSVIMTNAATFGGTTLFVDKKAGLQRSTLGQALQVLEATGNADAKKPEVLDLLRTNGNLFQTLSFIQQQMELLSGISAIMRGQVDPNIKSGAHAALIHSQALEFSSGFIGDFNRLMEQSGTLVFELLKRFAVNTRTIPVIVGKSQKWTTKAFEAQDLADIDRVQVDVINPLMRSIPGRLSMADSLMQLPDEKARQAYISILTTGRMEPLTEAPMTRVMNLKRENELLMEGVLPKALSTDIHPEHIMEHLSLLDNPEVRDDDELAGLILQHVMEHIDLHKNLDPDIAAVLGIPPLPSQAPMGPPPPGMEGAPADPNAPLAPGAEVPLPGPEDPNLPNLPNMPKNPISGEEWDPKTGGLNTPA